MMLAILLLFAGAALRFIPHAPNMTPVAAIALFSGAYLHKKYSLFIPLILMAATDIVLGLHDVIFFTWGSFFLIALLGQVLRKQKSVSLTLTASVASGFLFFIISNFGVWLVGWYPRTIEGLITCYVMAVPFLRSFVISTVGYTIVLFGAYEIVAYSVRKTSFAKVLLS